MMEVPEIVTTPPQTEKHRFIWKIDNFSEILNSLRNVVSTNRLTTEFDAGATIGLISSWRLTFTLSNACQPVRGTKWYIPIAKTGGHPNATFFSCHASVKHKQVPTVNMLRVELHRKQLSRQFGRLGEMTDSSVENALEVHVEFELWPNRDPATTDIIANNLYLLVSGEESDAVIVVKDRDGDEETEIKVHRNILGAGSIVFQKMLDSPMKERETGVVFIEDFSPACVNIMLKFIYTGNFDNDWKNVAEKMVRAADKYNLEILTQYLDRNLHLVCTIENAKRLRLLARMHGLEIAIKKITHFIISNVD